MMSESFKDRRQYTRIYRNFILSYHEKGKADIQYDISQVNNISKGGINFIATHPFDEGIVIVLEMKTPFIADSVHMEGSVLESKEKIPQMIYEIRLQFKDLPPQVLEVLDKIERYSLKLEGE